MSNSRILSRTTGLFLLSVSCVGKAPQTRQPTPEPEAKLVAYWHLDDPGQAIDEVGQRAGVLPAGLETTSGVAEGAYALDGTGAVSVDVGSGFDFSNGFSASVWVRPRYASGEDQVRRDVLSQWKAPDDAFADGTRLVNVASQGLVGGIGYWGASFDGRHMNMMGYGEQPATFSRLDTWGQVDDLSNWEHQTPNALFDELGPILVGFINTGFDGRHVYFSPYNNGTWSSTTLRYDTTQPYDDVASWSYFDIADSSLVFQGAFFGIQFDGRYIYYRPSTGDRIPRFDTHADFANPASWGVFDTTSKPGFERPLAFYGSTLARGRLFWPSRPSFSYDLKGDYTSPDAWTVVGSDAATTIVATSDAVLLRRDGACIIERYPSHGDFTPDELVAPAETFDPCASFSHAPTQIRTAYYDGRYVYFFGYGAVGSNYGNPRPSYRYDTMQSFTDAGAWESFEPSSLPANDLVGGFSGASFDGRYIYAWPAKVTEESCGGACDRGARNILVRDTLGTEESWRLSVSESGFNGSGGHPLGPSASIVTGEGAETRAFSVYSNQRLEADTWYHLAVTYDGEALVLYIDGVEAARRPASGVLRAPTTPLTIGGMTAGTAMFSGALDEVRIYRGPMSAEQLEGEVCAGSSDKAICVD